MGKHLGIIRIDSVFLLEWLQFNKGDLINSRLDYSRNPPTLELIVSHPDMPALQKDGYIPTVTPNYTKHFDTKGNLVSVERNPLQSKIVLGAKTASGEGHKPMARK